MKVEGCWGIKVDNKFLLNQQQMEQYIILVGLSTIVQITSIFVPFINETYRSAWLCWYVQLYMYFTIVNSMDMSRYVQSPSHYFFAIYTCITYICNLEDFLSVPWSSRYQGLTVHVNVMSKTLWLYSDIHLQWILSQPDNKQYVLLS